MNLNHLSRPFGGIDEAGRGTLCGSLFVAGVVCEDSSLNLLIHSGIRDSKTLSKNKRAELVAMMTSLLGFHFIIIKKTARQIDSQGLSFCLRESLQEIISALMPYTSHFIYDGNTTFQLTPPSSVEIKTLVKGDSKLPQIAAASILAKHSKDKEMEYLHSLYPDYLFNLHSGYGTKIHREKIATLGLIKEHRKSFLKNFSSHCPTSLFE